MIKLNIKNILWLSISLAIIGVFTFLVYGTEKNELRFIKNYDISRLQHDTKENAPIVDMVVFHSKSSGITWVELQEEIQNAYAIFLKNGVHLNLVQAYQVEFPEAWHGIPIIQYDRTPEVREELGHYDKYKKLGARLPIESEKILENFTGKNNQFSRTIYIVTLSNLVASWFEKNAQGEWFLQSSKTSATSFPSYVLGDRTPQTLRGLLSIQSSKPHRKVIAHEVGHKLINVSHEGKGVCPHGSGKGVPGLLGYGDSREIYGGHSGRWHKERLLLSPFIYKWKNNKKIWNQDYQSGGGYDDIIYKNFVIDPVCPNNTNPIK